MKVPWLIALSHDELIAVVIACGVPAKAMEAATVSQPGNCPRSGTGRIDVLRQIAPRVVEQAEWNGDKPERR
jgi:hypothetical protein